MGQPRVDAWLLGGLTYSFAFVMLSVCVPDHFIMSMFMLVLTLYVAGRKMKSGQLLTRWQTVWLFVLTAGMSLNNDIKVFLAALFVNGRRFWRLCFEYGVAAKVVFYGWHWVFGALTC